MQGQRNYVILCRERTGSNYLVHVLAQHLEITTHNELFHETAIFGTREEISDVEVIRGRDAEPVGCLKREMDECRTKVFGFKHRNFYTGDAVTEFVLRAGFHVITLERENVLAQYSSMRIAMETGQWTLKRGAQAVVSEKLEWDEEVFEQYRGEYAAEYQELYQRIRRAGVPWLMLRYTELFKRETIAEVFGFLSVAEMGIEEGVQKQNTSRIVERFRETKVVGEYLSRIGKQEWREEIFE